MVNSKLEFEIYVDDVKCLYGFIMGQIDEEVIFYLCVCGIGELSVRKLMVFVFIEDVFFNIENEVVLNYVY